MQILIAIFILKNCPRDCPMDNLWTQRKNRPRTQYLCGRFVPTILLIFQKHLDTHYIRRNSCCPMDGHKDSPVECPKPYRNRNRYLLLYIYYGQCPMDVLRTHFYYRFGVLQKYSVKIKIYLLTWCKAVLSYACKKARRCVI